MTRAAQICVLLVVALPTLGSGQETSDVLDRMAQRIQEVEGDLIEFRRDLHRHPEVSGQEERTARLVAARLEALGFSVRRGVGGHGVVGLLTGAREGPVVAFRADMDAVRSMAPDPVDFRSVEPGVRHICGHDIHTTIGIALAEGAAAVRDVLEGSLMLVFQPAEENATGARAMLADDVFGSVRPSAIFAFHTAPLEVGQLATAPTTLMPGRDRFRVRWRGTDASAATVRIRQAVLGAGTIPPEAAFTPQQAPFALIQMGEPIARDDGSWLLQGMTTTSSPTASARARESMERGLEALETPDVQIELEYEERSIAGVTNDPGLVERASQSATQVLGEGSVLSLSSMTPAFSEDFGSFQEAVPGVMFFLGVSNSEKGWVGMPHSPDYVADEASIAAGATAMGRVLLDFLAAGS